MHTSIIIFLRHQFNSALVLATLRPAAMEPNPVETYVDKMASAITTAFQGTHHVCILSDVQPKEENVTVLALCPYSDQTDTTTHVHTCKPPCFLFDGHGEQSAHSELFGEYCRTMTENIKLAAKELKERNGIAENLCMTVRLLTCVSPGVRTCVHFEVNEIRS